MKKIHALLFLTICVDFMVEVGILIPTIPFYVQRFGASAAAVGMTMTLYALPQVIFVPLWGRLSDRIGRKRVLLLGLAGSCVSMLLLASAQSMAWVYLSRAIAGLFGANLATAFSYISDTTDEQNRTKGMGIVAAGLGLGGMIIGPIVGAASASVSLTTPFMIASGLAFANLLFTSCCLPEAPRGPSSPRAAEDRLNLGLVQNILQDPRTRGATVIIFVTGLAVAAIQVTLALVMAERFGYSPQQLGPLFVLMGVTTAAVQGGLVGKLARRLSEQRLVVVATVVNAVATALIALAPAPALVFAAIVIFGFGQGLIIPSLNGLASLGAPPHRKGATMGILNAAMSLSMVVGPPIFGVAHERLGNRLPLLAASGVFVASALIAAAWRWRPLAAAGLVGLLVCLSPVSRATAAEPAPAAPAASPLETRREKNTIIQLKVLNSNSGRIGLMFSKPNVRYSTERWYFGDSLVFSPLLKDGKPDGVMFEGGPIAGFQGRLSPSWQYDFSVQLELGGASVKGDNAGIRNVFGLDPAASLRFPLSKTIWGNVGVSYHFAPTFHELSGITAFVRLDESGTMHLDSRP